MKNLYLFIVALTLFVSCSKESIVEKEPELIPKIELSGHVEKGPFVKGATITAYELSNELTPTGKSFKTELINNIGEFSFPKFKSSAEYFELVGNGYYFNENTGKLSNSTLTLNVILNLKSNSKISINVLTHLEQKRVKYLINKGVSFNKAKFQASKELLNAFFIKESSVDFNSEDVTLTKNSNYSNALLGISSLLLQLAQNNDAKLTELLSDLSNDLEKDGKFNDEISKKIAFEIALLNYDKINQNLKERMSESGLVLSDFNFSNLFQEEFSKRMQSIDVKAKELILLTNEKLPLEHSISPINACNKDLVWRSSEPGIVSVNTKGELIGISKGDATITVESASNPEIKTTVRIRVLDKIVVSISNSSSKSDYTVNNGYYNGTLTLGVGLPDSFKFLTNSNDKESHAISINRIEMRENNKIIKFKEFNDLIFPTLSPGARLINSLDNVYKPQFYLYFSFRGKNYIQIFTDI